VKEKILYFFIQYGRFGDMDKVAHERKVLANLSDGWGPFLASSDAQLIDVRQIELFKKKMKAEKKGDTAEIKKIDAELQKVKKLSEIVGQGGY
jgi:phosphonate transport system substrate-binding protein